MERRQQCQSGRHSTRTARPRAGRSRKKNRIERGRSFLRFTIPRRWNAAPSRSSGGSISVDLSRRHLSQGPLPRTMGTKHCLRSDPANGPSGSHPRILNLGLTECGLCRCGPASDRVDWRSRTGLVALGIRAAQSQNSVEICVDLWLISPPAPGGKPKLSIHPRFIIRFCVFGVVCGKFKSKINVAVPLKRVIVPSVRRSRARSLKLGNGKKVRGWRLAVSVKAGKSCSKAKGATTQGLLLLLRNASETAGRGRVGAPRRGNRSGKNLRTARRAVRSIRQ